MTAPSPFPWLRAHWRLTAEVVVGVVLLAAGWAVHRPAPVIDLHQHDQVETHATQHQVEQKQVREQATVAAKVEQHEAKQVHRHIRVTTRRLPSGEVDTTRDVVEDEGEQLELAQQVDLHATTAAKLTLDLTSAVAQVATHDLQLHQEPAPAPRFLLQAMAGIGGSGPVYGGEAAWSPGQVPLIKVPVWIGLAVLVPTDHAPMFLGAVGLQL